jgi:hypothetical protein
VHSFALNGCLEVGEGARGAIRCALGRTRTRPLAAELGTQRLRRYGHFAYNPSVGAARRLMHDSFAQPEDSDPLEPLTDTFASDPLPHAMLALLGRIATALDDAAEWRQAHAVSRFDFHGRRGSADAGGSAPRWGYVGRLAAYWQAQRDRRNSCIGARSDTASSPQLNG